MVSAFFYCTRVLCFFFFFFFSSRRRHTRYWRDWSSDVCSSDLDVQATALLALVKIGKPSVDQTVKLLKGQNDNLSSFAARRVKEVSGAKELPKRSEERRVGEGCECRWWAYQ